MRVATLTGASYAPSSPTDLLRSVGLAGKAFAMNGTRYVPLAFETDQQPTNFVADEAGNIVAKMLQNVGIGQLWGATNGTTNPLLPETSVLGNHVFLAMQERFATQGLKVQSKIVTTSDPGAAVITQTTSAGVTKVDLYFGTQMNRAVLASALHFGGGIVWMYDGASAVEHGFHMYPENVTVPSPGGDHVYQHAVCYEWMDLQGNLHRSAPSPAVLSQQPADIDASNPVRVAVPTLRLTAKQLASSAKSRRPVVCVLYRTLDKGSVFYRTNQTIAATANDTTVDTITITDTTPDSELQFNQQLYTTGGVLENQSAPPPAYLQMLENRLWLIDATNRLKLWFSKEVIPGSPVEFSDFLTFNLEPRGDGAGGATGVVRLDQRTIVFREGGISYLTGLGPDPTGSQYDYEETQLPAEMGCTEPASIIAAGDGILFKSAKGFFKLNRDLSTTYIGADVEAYNDQRVTSATLLPKTNWALITLSSGVALMYDYLMNQWSVFPNLNAVDGGVYQKLHVWLDANGVVHQETPGVFSDGGEYIPIRLSTSWVQLAGLQGYKRIWEFLILGDWISSHKLRVDIAYDFDGRVVKQTNTISSPTQIVPLQYRIQCAVQQCQAIQITLTELPPDAGTTGTDGVSKVTPGEGLTLSGITFAVGLKPGLFRMPASKTFG